MGSIRILKKPEDLFVFAINYVVTAAQIWSETHINTTVKGGGGFLSRGTGRIDPVNVTVSSSSNEVLRLFLKDDDGLESELKLHDPGIGIGEGHKISVIYAGDQQSQRGYHMGVVNHNTRRYAVYEDRADLLLFPVSFRTALIVIIAIPFFMGLFGHFIIPDPAIRDYTGLGLMMASAILYVRHTYLTSRLRRSIISGLRHASDNKLRDQSVEGQS